MPQAVSSSVSTKLSCCLPSRGTRREPSSGVAAAFSSPACIGGMDTCVRDRIAEHPLWLACTPSGCCFAVVSPPCQPEGGGVTATHNCCPRAVLQIGAGSTPVLPEILRMVRCTLTVQQRTNSPVQSVPAKVRWTGLKLGYAGYGLKELVLFWAVAMQPGCLSTHLPRSLPAGMATSTAAQAPTLPLSTLNALACQLHGNRLLLRWLLGPLLPLQEVQLSKAGLRCQAARP